MLDLGWTELLVIGIVALIVVGPKDLPGMFRAVGNFVGKAKRMARDFSQAMNDAADESGVKDVSDSLRKASNPMGSAMDEVKKASSSFTQDTMSGPKKQAEPTSELSEERREKAEKIRQKSADAATKRLAEEEAARVEAEKAEAAASDDAADAPPEDSKA